MLDGLTNSGALPVLERLLQFTEARHRVLVNDIANLSTPYFKPTDLSVDSFTAALGAAVERRRAGGDPATGPLDVADTEQLNFTNQGLTVTPGNTDDNILFHDQNNRNVERLMQHLAENTLANRTAVELIRSEVATLQAAIRERV